MDILIWFGKRQLYQFESSKWRDNIFNIFMEEKRRRKFISFKCCLKYRFHEIETELSTLCLWTIHLCSRLLPAHFSIHPFWITIFHVKKYFDVLCSMFILIIIKWMKWKKGVNWLTKALFCLTFNHISNIHAINIYDYFTVQPCMNCNDVNVLSLMWWKSYYAVQCAVCGLCIAHVSLALHCIVIIN